MTAHATTATAAHERTQDAVRLDSVTKIYGRGERAHRALDDVSVTVPRGRFVALMGPSGSGKSTFLHCAAGLDHSTSGTAHIGDVELNSLNEARLTELRRRRVGFVFQAFNLVQALTVRQNVELPLRLAGERLPKEWFAEVLAQVGLTGAGDRRPAQLSGGQQQRVAIARALITRPDVLFGDEPTGALDTMTAKEILGVLRGCVDDTGQTVVMVTHDPAAASYADSVLFLVDGQIAAEMHAPSTERVAATMTELGAWAR